MNSIVFDKETSLQVGKYISFSLASLLTYYPDENFKQDLKDILKSKDLVFFCEENFGNLWKELNLLLKQIIKNKIDIDNIRSDYIDLFDRAKSLNSLYETEYGKARVMAKTTELADISGFYKAFGLERETDDINNDMPDHVSIELEFYSYLLVKQIFLKENNIIEGVEIIEDAKKKFMNSHLGRFVKSITKCPGVVSNKYFSTVFNWIDALVYNECKNIGVEPTIVDWIASQADDDIIDCAISGCSLNKIEGGN